MTASTIPEGKIADIALRVGKLRRARAVREPTKPPVVGDANANDGRAQVALLLTTPWPPTGNTNVRHGNGGHYLTPAHKAFRAHVAVNAVSIGVHRARLNGSLSVEIHATPPDKRARDLDNIAKPILDALQAAGVIESDRLVDRLMVRRIRPEQAPGWCVVRISLLDPLTGAGEPD